MRRLAATIWCDVRLQLRNGFYYASALVVVALVVLLAWLPQEAVTWLLPVVIFENVMTNTFFFVAGMVLLEKGEGTLEAQVVTPLRTGEYLLSKVVTLTALSLVESLIIATAALGFDPELIALAIGITLASVFLCLVGVALVIRYRSINEYLMPAVVYSMLLSLPLLGYFGIGPGVLYDWHPVQGAVDFMRIDAPLRAGRVVYAVVFPLLCIGAAYLWSRRALHRSAMR